MKSFAALIIFLALSLVEATILYDYSDYDYMPVVLKRRYRIYNDLTKYLFNNSTCIDGYNKTYIDPQSHLISEGCCEGYRFDDDKCRPQCEPPCIKGTCKEPNVCMCYEGYQMQNNTDNKHLCVPVCTNGCVNGACVEPDVCVCDTNYFLDSDGFTCEPNCPPECKNNHGFCTEPNVCICQEGYTKVWNGDSYNCQPVCDRECLNGHCMAPNVCGCKEGYKLNDHAWHVECVPKCSEDCVHGSCTAPETCKCSYGYTAVNATVCKPFCGNCGDHGTCVSPWHCRCDPGYDNSAGFSKCEPHCDLPCGVYGHCTSPNNCSCMNGTRAVNPKKPYDLNNLSSMYICQPICDPECLNGMCVGPNMCICNLGYYSKLNRTERTQSNTCKPCSEVTCSSVRECKYHDCICDDGYKREGHNCKPVCAEECMVHGYCKAPNTCACEFGYEFRNENKCEPICGEECKNGDCVAPFECNCHDGFVHSPSLFRHQISAECIPGCIHNCTQHGKCVFNVNKYICVCDPGWTGASCEQADLCVVMTDFKAAREINGFEVNKSANRLILKQSYKDLPHCPECGELINSTSTCAVIKSNETLVCLFRTDLSCQAPPSNLSTRNILVGCCFTLIMAGIVMIGQFIYRQRKKMIQITSASYSANNVISTEALLEESATLRI